MTNFKRNLLVAAMTCFVSVGAFGQRDDKRPPKQPDRVVVDPKPPREKPPQNNQGDKRKNDKKGKP